MKLKLKKKMRFLIGNKFKWWDYERWYDHFNPPSSYLRVLLNVALFNNTAEAWGLWKKNSKCVRFGTTSTHFEIYFQSALWIFKVHQHF